MTAHYIALAQSDPQQYQTIRDKIVDSIEAWAKEKNKYAKDSAQSVKDWFEQIAKVNKARGAKQGDKNLVTKDTYFEGFDADLEPQEKAEKEEAKQRGFGLI